MATIAGGTIKFDADFSDIERGIYGVSRAIAGIAIAKGTFDFFADGVKQLGELERVAAQTNAVIKSTGGVANVTAQHVRDLGDAMEAKTGIDQVQIETGANLLLTFKKIHNEAGKGNDIFDRSVKLATDMSVAFGQDMKSSAIQLGKALDDPIRGMTALRRIGIQFSESQEKTIKKLVETGDVLGAQKLILKEVESQVAGSAEAYGKTLPGQLEIAKQAIGDMQMSMAAGLVPVLELAASASTFLAEKVQELPGPLAGAAAGVLGFGTAALLMAPQINAAIQVVSAVGPKVLEAGAGAAKMAGNFALGAVSAGQLGSGAAAAVAGVAGVAAVMVGAGLGVAYLAGAFDYSGVSAEVFGQRLAKMPLKESVPAFQNLGAAIQKAGESTVMANGPLLDGTLTLGVFKETAKASHPAALALAQAIEAYGLAGKNGLPTQKEMNAVLAESRGKFAESAGAASASKEVIDSYAATVAAAKQTIDDIKLATDEWTVTVQAGLGPALDATAATINYQAAVDKLTEALLLDTTHMDLNEASGRNVAAALVNLTGSTIEDTQAQIALAIAHGENAKASDIANFASQGLASSIMESGASAGLSGDEMVMYTAKILNIPPEAVTTIIENSSSATDAVAGFISYLLSKDGTSISTSVNNYINTIYRNVGTPLAGPRPGLSGVGGDWAAGGIAGAAMGEVVRGPALRWIGEAGPEAVVPLGRGARDSRNRSRVMANAGLMGGGDMSRVEYLLERVVANQERGSARTPSRSIIGARA